MGEFDSLTLRTGYQHLLDAVLAHDPELLPHIDCTAERSAKAVDELLSGYLVQEPSSLLKTFPNTSSYSQMIHVKRVVFYSTCAHHLLPFFGSAYFAYIPKHGIVGLSKIPRLIHTFSKRLQVQERLTDDIVSCFNETVQPIGCGLVMRGYHMCMTCRGVEEPSAFTETTALRGSFLHSAKSEFLRAVANEKTVWG